MIRSLPFSALRAFEVVVRLGGFSAAADELGISQSAVSQHVKALEEWLGQALLTRGARTSIPTREGEQLARAVAEGLGRISDTCTELQDRRRADDTVTISCLPGFAFTWLFPRLLRFDLNHPEVIISITTDTGRAPFSPAQADIGIRYGFGQNPGLHVEHLMGEQIFPVCAPHLLDGPLPDIETFLAEHPLLQDEHGDFGGSKPDWAFFARECGISLPPRLATRRFGQANMVVQAAAEGLGIALGRGPLVIDALTDGRLVRPYPHVVASPLSYWLVCQPLAQDIPKFRLFMDWIKREARNQPALPETAPT
ncbi:LysR substrate-binding domain-containing protein [Oceaniglobus roseus]|uniref:LysR substrate-binding domain-containing protein n=1 Tax=Oceaniglobus roseus TaxID=1737570 RepID=UPI000C7EE768|nr:LysR substrate-binding domain-containing protein [Kandeliimicrobium roseum]